MKAVVQLGAVIAIGNYTPEDYEGLGYGELLFIDITQEQYDVISQYEMPRYENEIFFDGVYDSYKEMESTLQDAKIAEGKKIYCWYIGELYIDFRMGKFTNGAYEAKKSLLKSVRNELLAGDFDYAKQELTQLGNSVLGLDFYNKLLLKIDTAIFTFVNTYEITQPTQLVSRTVNSK